MGTFTKGFWYILLRVGMALGIVGIPLTLIVWAAGGSHMYLLVTFMCFMIGCILKSIEENYG